MKELLRHCRPIITGILFATLLIQGCTTVDRGIQTPAGPVEQLDGPLHILRIVRKTTTTGNQADARGGPITENIAVSCPANTQTAIPAIQGLAYGYGEVSPDDLSMVDPVTGGITATVVRANERPLGMVHSNIAVVDIDAPDASDEQRVTLTVTAFLSDSNADDPWWWVASYTVLCLGTNR